jgi:triphosphoribosyl-dephospho-CoA synthetase
MIHDDAMLSRSMPGNAWHGIILHKKLEMHSGRISHSGDTEVVADTAINQDVCMHALHVITHIHYACTIYYAVHTSDDAALVHKLLPP